LTISALICFIAALHFLWDQPIFLEWRRPANVPRDAVFVAWVKGGAWEHCVYSEREGVDRCTVWNWGGEIINSGIYVPTDGRWAAAAKDLRIRRGVTPGDTDMICLENGRELLPERLAHRKPEFPPWIFEDHCPELPPSR
jgi:hypothetical protein